MDSEEKALLHIFVAGLFRFYFIMEKTILDKPFLTFEKQINKLINEKNLIINDHAYALEVLSSISYYDLVNGYKDLYQKDDVFIPGLGIEQLFITHIFNKNIQGVIVKYAGYAENSFKTILSYIIAKNISEEQTEYLNPKHYKYCRDTNKRQYLRTLLNDILKLCNETGDTPTSHYRKTKDHVPPWILFKNVSFSSTTDIYKYLKTNDKKDMFTYFRLLSTSNMNDDAKANILLSALNIVRKFRNKATHNLNFTEYRAPLFKSANHIFENTLLYTNEINKTYDDIWGLILSMIILLNNKHLEYVFLSELSTYLNSYGSNMSKLYCRMTGIPIDYQKRFELYSATLTTSSTDYNQEEKIDNATILQDTYPDVAATSETAPEHLYLKYNYRLCRRPKASNNWKKKKT